MGAHCGAGHWKGLSTSWKWKESKTVMGEASSAKESPRPAATLPRRYHGTISAADGVTGGEAKPLPAKGGGRRLASLPDPRQPLLLPTPSWPCCRRPARRRSAPADASTCTPCCSTRTLLFRTHCVDRGARSGSATGEGRRCDCRGERRPAARTLGWRERERSTVECARDCDKQCALRRGTQKALLSWRSDNIETLANANQHWQVFSYRY